MRHPSYYTVRRLIKDAGFESRFDYLEKHKELGVPSNPEHMYRDRWEGWNKFLNIANAKSNANSKPIVESLAERLAKPKPVRQQRISQRIIDSYPAYNKIKYQLKKLQYENKALYLVDAEKFNFPVDPESVYWKEWEGWDTFLSTLRSERALTSTTVDQQWVNRWLTKRWSDANG